VLLVARDDAYEVLTWVMVAPITTRLRDIPTTVLLDPVEDGVPRLSVVALDNIQSVHRDDIDTYISRLAPETLQAVERAILAALGLPG
jgi:mRNA interferase MazF